MKFFNKITSLLVVLVLVLGCFASCNDQSEDIKPGGEVNTNTNKDTFQKETYAVNVSVNFETEDEDMKAAVEAMNRTGTTLLVDGDKISLNSIVMVDDISVNNNYVYVDGMLYHINNTMVGMKLVSSYEMASLTEEERDSLLSDLGAGAEVGVADFENCEIGRITDGFSYTCSGVKKESADSLCDIIASRFKGLNATVKLVSADYVINIVNKRDENSTLSCNFVIGMNDKEYEITMNIYSEFDYEKKISISAPANSENYTVVTYKDIIG